MYYTATQFTFKEKFLFWTMFWQQATKATTVNSPYLTYFFLNFSWFNKQLGNEKHNYSLEVLLWRCLLEFFFKESNNLKNVGSSIDHSASKNNFGQKCWESKNPLYNACLVKGGPENIGPLQLRCRRIPDTLGTLTVPYTPTYSWKSVEIKVVLSYQSYLCFCKTNMYYKQI